MTRTIHSSLNILQEIADLGTTPLRKQITGSFDVNTEFKNLKVSLKRTENLGKLCNALLSVQPTSVEYKKVFSSRALSNENEIKSF